MILEKNWQKRKGEGTIEDNAAYRQAPRPGR
jgi:hypothetical protein